MKSTTVLYRYNDISRKNGFYSLNVKHAAITGAIYTLVSATIRKVIGVYRAQTCIEYYLFHVEYASI